jgi:hypothetical protein
MPHPAHPEHLTHPKYRADIDGLRAIAVLSVVGFHAFPNWIKGGFIGVDIFFVISGFLISTIIFENLKRNSFSFVEFYSRRIKRIFPALLLVLIASFTFGWFVLLADEYKQLGKHIVGGAGFVSNFVLWDESGYFDNTSETKPLLHLWSLGIEEQFYIVWPLLLWLAWKLKLNLLTLAFIVGLISFDLNIIGIGLNDSVSMFYSPQTRFWELLSGSILAHITLYEQKIVTKFRRRLDAGLGGFIMHALEAKLEVNYNLLRNIKSLLGAVLIATGFIFITKEKHFPGTWAVLPTVGAILIVSAGTQAWLNRVVLSNRVLVWFGLISFPLYLWHWPLLSFARIVESASPTREIRITAVFVSIILAWMTYRLIERPIRFGNYGKTKTVSLIVLMTVVACTGYSAYKMDGFKFRMNDRSEFLRNFENKYPSWIYSERMNIISNWRFECAFFDIQKYKKNELVGDVANSKPIDHLNNACFERDKKYEKAVLVWGDSHAQHLAPGLKHNLPSNWQMLQVASSACAPDIYSENPSQTNQCAQSNYFAIKTIKDAKPDVVVVAQSSGHTTQKFHEIANKLNNLGVGKVIFVGPTPQWTADLPKIITRKLWIMTPKLTFVGINKEILNLNSKLQSEFQVDMKKSYANVIDLFCNKLGCMTYIGDDRMLGITSFDYGHLTPIASDYLAKYLLVDLITGKESVSP